MDPRLTALQRSSHIRHAATKLIVISRRTTVIQICRQQIVGLPRGNILLRHQCCHGTRNNRRAERCARHPRRLVATPRGIHSVARRRKIDRRSGVGKIQMLTRCIHRSDRNHRLVGCRISHAVDAIVADCRNQQHSAFVRVSNRIAHDRTIAEAAHRNVDDLRSGIDRLHDALRQHKTVGVPRIVGDANGKNFRTRRDSGRQRIIARDERSHRCAVAIPIGQIFRHRHQLKRADLAAQCPVRRDPRIEHRHHHPAAPIGTIAIDAQPLEHPAAKRHRTGLHTTFGQAGDHHRKNKRLVFRTIEQPLEIRAVGESNPQGPQSIQPGNDPQFSRCPLEKTRHARRVLEDQHPLALERTQFTRGPIPHRVAVSRCRLRFGEPLALRPFGRLPVLCLRGGLAIQLRHGRARQPITKADTGDKGDDKAKPARVHGPNKPPNRPIVTARPFSKSRTRIRPNATI